MLESTSNSVDQPVFDAVPTIDAGCRLGHGCANNYECWLGCTDSPQCEYHGTCCAKSSDRLECVARSQEDCQKSGACREYAACHLVGDGCGPTSDQDCRGSLECRSTGKCALLSNVCVASSEGDCRSSIYCKQFGYCSYLNGHCEATQDNDCRNSLASCKYYGECSASGGNCVATSTADCAASTQCKYSGKCILGLIGGNVECVCEPDYPGCSN